MIYSFYRFLYTLFHNININGIICCLYVTRSGKISRVRAWYYFEKFHFTIFINEQSIGEGAGLPPMFMSAHVVIYAHFGFFCQLLYKQLRCLCSSGCCGPPILPPPLSPPTPYTDTRDIPEGVQKPQLFSYVPTLFKECYVATYKNIVYWYKSSVVTIKRSYNQA